MVLLIIRFLIAMPRVTLGHYQIGRTMHYCGRLSLPQGVCLHRGRQGVVAILAVNVWGSRKLEEVYVDDVQFGISDCNCAALVFDG